MNGRSGVKLARHSLFAHFFCFTDFWDIGRWQIIIGTFAFCKLQFSSQQSHQTRIADYQNMFLLTCYRLDSFLRCDCTKYRNGKNSVPNVCSLRMLLELALHCILDFLLLRFVCSSHSPLLHFNQTETSLYFIPASSINMCDVFKSSCQRDGIAFTG